MTGLSGWENNIGTGLGWLGFLDSGNDVRQREIHTAEPLVPHLTSLDVVTASRTLNVCNSQGIDQFQN
jgi:hypothetical protein